MQNPHRAPLRLIRGTAVTAILALLVLRVSSPAAAALTTESPEVKAAVAKGIAFLEKSSDERPGAKAVAGLMLVKDGRDAKHPKIQEAVAAIRAEIAKPAITIDVYSVGLSIIFLVELDPSRYRTEIDALIKHLLKIQQPWGSWGYEGSSTGDTSMTQYGVLSLWEASRANFSVPADVWERVANWLLRTQDPSGVWAYQGADPGNYQLVQQSQTRPSMGAAGLASVYICTDQFGLAANSAPAPDSNLPAALRPLYKSAQRTRAAKVDTQLLAAARARGDQWMGANYTVEVETFRYYYLYTFERYQSFREVLTGRPFSHPNWYDEGARKLIATQAADGSWEDESKPVPATAFALLFLVRSSLKSLSKTHGLGDGMLVGGRGLPTEEGELEVRMGKVMAKPLSGPAEQLLSVIEDARHPNYLHAIGGLEELVAAADAPELSRQAKRLRELAGGSAPEARATALKALGRTRNLDDAPLLIHALSDPNPAVFHAAEDGLRYMSRRFPPPGDPVDPDAAARLAAIKRWKSWYLSLRPAAILED